MIVSLADDLRFALRQMRRAPAFAASAAGYQKFRLKAETTGL